MNANASPPPLDGDATGPEQRSPERRMAMWVASVAPGFLAAFALASISGFVAIAGTFLSYDARGGIGPLAAVDDSKLILISRVCSYVVAPVTFAIATWRIGLLGALAAALGFVFLGPLLWGMSPWSSVDSSARLGYYDEGRGWIGLGLFLIVFLSFVIVVPITFVVRQIWRRSRHAA